MANLPPNPYSNSIPGAPATTNIGQVFNHNQQFNQLPPSQLPPGYGLKDSNSNSPLHRPQNSINNFNQSASNSPAFNQPGLTTSQPSPVRSVAAAPKPLAPNAPHSASPAFSNPSPMPYSSNSQQQRQINDNAPPLVPSSQYQPLVNGPSVSLPGAPGVPSGPPTSYPRPPGTLSVVQQYPVSNAYEPNRLPVSTSGFGPGPANYGPQPISKPPVLNQPSIPFSTQPSGPVSNSPLPSGPTVSGSPAFRGPPGQPSPMHSGSTVSGPPTFTGLPGQSMGLPNHLRMNGPNIGPQNQLVSGPPLGPPKTSGSAATGPVSAPFGQPTGPVTGGMGPPVGQMPNTGTQVPQSYPGPAKLPPVNQSLPPQGLNRGPVTGSQVPPQALSQNLPAVPRQLGPPSGPVQTAQPSNLQSRYPQMPSYNHQQKQAVPAQYPPQYSTHGVTQQMGQLSVTKQGFDQLWGHHMIDLLQCKHILPEFPEEPPEIRLGHQFADAPNCSPDIFRCTINRIPETNSLLQKSRLPLGILIHPFKDLNHLPVIQCTTIVRCRACRTYINPFVYFVDAKRWKCNLCYRVNDLPEEFQYDPVSKSYGDPARRPEIKSATIEFIAPGEYMLRPPQPAVYLFLFDVSQLARESGYLQVACDTLRANLEQLPGDARTQIGFLCFDSHVHYYMMGDGLTRPKEMTVLDIEDVFLPSPESLLVNLGERRELVKELLTVLPQRYCAHGVPGSALGAALQAAYKLMAPTGGRVTVFQTCLPNIGPGALQSREDPNARSSKEVAHLNPATDFYKRLALDCSGVQIAVDLFLLNSQYSDLATLSGMSKFSGGSMFHIPLFRATRAWQAEQLTRMITRYLTRKIGFEAVMRVRCTRGIAIHTFHGNFFVRSTDLLSLPNVSPDAGFGMQLTIEESLSDLQQVCFQAALLYTSSKGERRIRVHTLALPVASNLTDVLHAADQQCIIGLLSKMAVDRSVCASLGEAREALTTVAVDALSAHRLAQNLPQGAHSSALHAPASLKLLPLYLLALLKRKAFRTGTSTRLDDRVADMCALKSLPLAQLLRGVYPDLYPIHNLREHTPPPEQEEEIAPDPPRLQLSAERLSVTGAYLLDDSDTMIIYVGSNVSPAFLSETFGVTAFSQLPDEARSIPKIDSDGNALLHAFIDKLNDDRPYASEVIVLRDNSASRQLFTERLVEDRVESAFSYYEFLTHVKNQVK